jgi:hypothetical protein
MDEKNTDENSCARERTGGHDLLYFAKQSKTEIAPSARLTHKSMMRRRKELLRFHPWVKVIVIALKKRNQLAPPQKVY